MMMTLDHRVGRFHLDSDIMFSEPEATMRVFSNMLITRCEHLFYRDVFEYVAYSPLFRPVHPSEKVPLYKIEFNSETGEVKAVECQTK